MSKVRTANNLFMFTVLFYIAMAALGKYLPIMQNEAFSLLYLELTMPLPVIVYFMNNKATFKKIYRKPAKPALLLLAVLYVILLEPGTIFLNNLTSIIAYSERISNMTRLIQFPFPVMVLLTCVMPAVFEEMVARGAFLENYREPGAVKAAVMSGLFFGLLHMNLNQFSYAAYMGIMVGLFCESTDTIYSTMIVHFLMNFLSTYREYAFCHNRHSLLLNIRGPYTIRGYIICGLLSVICTILMLLINRLARRVRGEEKENNCKTVQGVSIVTPSLIVGIGICAFFIVYDLIK